MMYETIRLLNTYFSCMCAITAITLYAPGSMVTEGQEDNRKGRQRSERVEWDDPCDREVA